MTTIGATLFIKGELTSTEDISVHGRVSGHLQVRDALLTIAEEAQLHADIRGARIVVHGRVTGGIVASERIELTPTARVEGSLSANRVVVAEGAQFSGGIDMDQRTIAARMAQYKKSLIPDP